MRWTKEERDTILKETVPESYLEIVKLLRTALLKRLPAADYSAPHDEPMGRVVIYDPNDDPRERPAHPTTHPGT